MQMLSAGGVEVLSDGERVADEDNPRGYLELERVKQIKRDSSWLPYARGKAVKMISQLLFDLPATERYRVILMERDLDEILTSQEKMLARLGRQAIPRKRMKTAFQGQIARFNEWIDRQTDFEVLRIEYSALVTDLHGQAARIDEFIGGQQDVAAMASAIDPTLYRNRRKG